MSEEHTKADTSEHADFAREAEEERIGFAAEFWDFLKHNKKWWLAPILVALVAIGALVLLSATGAAPFIYPLF